MPFRSTLLAGLTLVTSLSFAQPPAEPPKPAESPAPAKAPTEEKTVYVQMTTSMGDIIIELDGEKAPISTENFLKYVDKKFYDGTIFHRIIPTFMVQGGGFTPDMKQKPTEKPITNEWKNGLKNTRGTLAMARLGDRGPNPKTVDSATSQFFINVVDNAFLDRPQPDGGAYAVFGRVISGMDTVDKIKAVKTGSKSGMQDVPVETVEIKSVKRISAEEAKKTADKK
jgi:cyclophilin family peptidyl-prolyl cis-trans isomerase